MSAFVAMGGYGAYVWPSFGVTALTMAALLVHALRARRRARCAVARLEAGQAGRDDRRRSVPA